MRIGFIQEDEDDDLEALPGYAEAGINEDVEGGSWLSWAWRVFFDFCVVYGFLALIQDLIDYPQAW